MRTSSPLMLGSKKPISLAFIFGRLYYRVARVSKISRVNVA